mmetsp:Transcript_6545/g.11293  ORF Transcript_6545/g.11293 Transcript_6545/m.11293 type:complete len:246 (+) Transcript_6545:1091-1828(+)
MREILRRLILLVLARRADRDVHVSAQVAVLHVAVAGAEVEHDLTQLHHVGRCLLGRADVRLGDDLHQRDSGAVEVDEGQRRVHVMDRLACVLLQVDALDPDGARKAFAQFHQYFAFADDRVVKLTDLIALRQVRVEVVLPIEGRGEVDLCLQAQARTHRLCHAGLVDDGQHTGHACVHEGHVGVRLGAEFGRGTREQLGVGGDLRMNLHPDHKLPILLGARDHAGFRGVVGQVKHGSLRKVSEVV